MNPTELAGKCCCFFKKYREDGFIMISDDSLPLT
jgi:hypothetical protein